jgi:hypothetical protein
MMHSGDTEAAMGRIVAVTTDPDNGETLMTSEFTDASGVTHRDTQTAGYHYAPGEPEVGQAIEYLYIRSDYAGELHAYPRADRILQVAFGVPMLFMVLMAMGGAWLVLRQRNLRRRLLRSGRRERAHAPSIRRRQLAFPIGNRVETAPMWRLEARYFEPTRSEFVDCHSDWQVTAAPSLDAQATALFILVDASRPSRYWLPVGAWGVPAP